MNPLFRPRWVALVAGLMALALAAPTFADDKPSDSKALDRYLYTSLRYVINHGVDLYNSGRHEDCYNHFRTSLQDLIPVLTAHPDLQKTIKDDLDKIEKDPDFRVKMAAKATMPNPDAAPAVQQKAFALRAVFNEVRTALNADGTKPPPPEVTGTIEGTVLLDGKAVGRGKASVTSSDGKTYTADVGPEGKFKIEKVPVGAYKGSVTGPGIPESYSDPKTSGIKLDVGKGLNVTFFATKGPTKPVVPPEDETGSIDGAVNLDTKPLAKGTLTAIDKNDKSYTAEIKEGQYKLTKLPLGKYSVTIKGDGVPAKYGDAKTSGMSMDIAKKGANIPSSYNVYGDKPKPTGDEGTVKGKVTLNGKPLATGKVALIDKDGKMHVGAIAADGSYAIDKVPAGSYKVAITGGGAPAKFGDAKTTPLQFDVKKGENTHDAALKD